MLTLGFKLESPSFTVWEPNTGVSFFQKSTKIFEAAKSQIISILNCFDFFNSSEATTWRFTDKSNY